MLFIFLFNAASAVWNLGWYSNHPLNLVLGSINAGIAGGAWISLCTTPRRRYYY